MDEGRQVADAQLRTARSVPKGLGEDVLGATSPGALAAVISGWQPPVFPDQPAQMRDANAAALGVSPNDLAYRRLYPGLDLGIYACSHSMGVPSVVGPAAVRHHLAELATRGIAVWDDGAWVEVMDRYRCATATLVGGNLEDGDVAWFPNVSESLSAVLECIDGGELVYTAGHFTTGHYVHHRWAANTGGTLVEVPVDADGSVPTERILSAVTPRTRVLSISHALFESGWLQDLPALAAGLRARAPDAMLLLDAYQTAGTVPIDAAALGDHVVVTAAGHKQLRSGTGAGFLYVPRRWLRTLIPRRTGWWGHAAPFAFEKGAVRLAEDGTRFRTGTPTVIGMTMLLGELAALASSADGNLDAAVHRARHVTSSLVDVALRRATHHGLRVRGDWTSHQRGAFVCVEVERGHAVNEALAAQGIRVDVRPRADHGGWIRVSGNSAAFAYEIEAVIDAIAGVA